MSVKPLIKGDKVVMHTCMEAETHYGEIWTCKTNEFTSPSGSQVVFLEGFSGYFMCNYLQFVKVDSDIKTIIHERLNYLEKEECTNESRTIERMIRYDEVLMLLNQINYESEEQNGFTQV